MIRMINYYKNKVMSKTDTHWLSYKRNFDPGLPKKLNPMANMQILRSMWTLEFDKPI